MSKRIGFGLIVAAVVAMTAAPAGACGGLVGENGTIQLARTTTLAAYHDGVERYVTSFEFSGQGKEVGSIVPLPGVPTKVERGGDWTLQRLEREVAPPVASACASTRAQGAPRRQGAGDPRDEDRRARHHDPARAAATQVGKWARRPRLPAHARRARGARLLRAPQPDLHGRALRRARAPQRSGRQRGDGTPIMLTIPTKEPWVPLRILEPRARRRPRSSRPTCSCSPTTSRSCSPVVAA